MENKCQKNILKHFKKTSINIHSNWKLTFFPSAEEGLELPVGLDISEHSAIFHMFPKMYMEEVFKCIFPFNI